MRIVSQWCWGLVFLVLVGCGSLTTVDAIDETDAAVSGSDFEGGIPEQLCTAAPRWVSTGAGAGVGEFPAGEVLRAASASGQLTRRTVGVCSGALIQTSAGPMFATAGHCVDRLAAPGPLAALCRELRVVFGAEVHNGVIQPGASYGCASLPEANTLGADYALIRLDGDGGARFNPLSIVDAPNAGEPVLMVHHPAGMPRVASAGRVVSVREGRATHTCDTMPGSSGAHLVGRRGQTLVSEGLHVSGGCAVLGTNGAITWSSIAASSPLLRETLSTPASAEVPPAKRPCVAGTTRCGTVCVDTNANLAHCGRCDRNCALTGAATLRCIRGECLAERCLTDRGDCDGHAENGCETDLQSSPSHCGACGHDCGVQQLCQRGACVPEASVCGPAVFTVPCGVGACPRGSTCSDGRCVCTGGQFVTCNGEVCGAGCPPGHGWYCRQ